MIELMTSIYIYIMNVDDHNIYKPVGLLMMTIYITRSLGPLRDLTSSWKHFGPLDFVLRALWALRPVRQAR